MNEKAIDSCLIQKTNCVTVQNGISDNQSTLKSKFLLSAFRMARDRERHLPILFAKKEPVKFLFVCGPNFFNDEDDDAPPVPPERKRLREDVTRILKTDPSQTSQYDSQPSKFLQWSNAKLMAEVRNLVMSKELELYVMPVDDEPPGSFDLCRHVYQCFLISQGKLPSPLTLLGRVKLVAQAPAQTQVQVPVQAQTDC